MPQPAPQQTLLHGTSVVLNHGLPHPAAILLRGSSGSGKSDLAFRLIAQGATLLSDDQVLFKRRNDKITAECVEAIRGMMEIRGVGLVRLPVAPPTRLDLVIDLVPLNDVPRLPQKASITILGVQIPLLKLHAFADSTPFKVRIALECQQTPNLLIE